MVRKSSAPLFALFLLAMLAILPTLTGCAKKEPTPQVEVITVSMLVQVGDKDSRWFRDVKVPKGTNGYELTEKVAGATLKAKYYPEYRSHFVDAILGVENKNPNFWLVYVWNQPQLKWEPVPVGADLYSLKEGHILAWYYGDTSKKDDAPPVIP